MGGLVVSVYVYSNLAGGGGGGVENDVVDCG